MFRPVPMVHVRVQIPNRDAAAATRCIAREGLLHLVDIAHGRVGEGPTGQSNRELLSAFRDIAHRLRRLADRLGLAVAEPTGNLAAGDVEDFAAERDRIEARLAPFEHRVEEASARAREAKIRTEEAGAAIARLARIQKSGVDLQRLAALRFATVKLAVAALADLTELARFLDPAPFAVFVLESDGERRLAALAVPASGRERLESALRLATCEVIRPPEPDEKAEALVERRREEEEKLQRADADLAEAREQGAPLLEEWIRRAEVSLLLLQAQANFATAGRFVVIAGWLPADSAGRLRAAILQATSGRAVIDVETPENLPEAHSATLRVPILHRNPVLLRPFQKLVQLYGTPSYEEVEPTAFFAISFLLMFGLMFGDIGHGLVLFLAGYSLYRYIPRYLDYGILLMEAGCASALFGALYGSFFGIENLLPVLWLSPMRDIQRFMGIAIGFGVVLVSAGLVLNMINTWRSGEKARALFGAGGLFGAFFYWVALALLARALIPTRFVVPLGLILSMLAVPVVLLILRPMLVRRFERGRPRATGAPHAARWLSALEGSVELVDTLFSYFANTLSFIRVAAFAAVHAGVFIAVFALADTLARVRLGGLFSVVTVVLGNVVIIFLEGLAVSVQVLRLEYYEFFGKFFRGGGEPYRPLMLRSGSRKGES
jgi:V/A-type H+/Na+-transporting ATPase subunit I